MKAFLSHSSRDKEFVRAVAKELGRQFCVFDEQVFTTGTDFKESIERGLDDSSVFVLFASRPALESVWVKFETDEAWIRRLRAGITKSLVYLIDGDVDVDHLPEWLRRALVRRETSPKIIARDIRHHLDELLRERQHPYFVGRTQDTEELEQALTPIDGSPPPHAVFVAGLPGIGRRSLIRRTAPSILNLRKYVELRLGEGDSISDVCITLADRVEPYATREGFEAIVRAIKSLRDAEALQRTLRNLRTMITAGELPIFFDEGGLLDADGYLREPIAAIIGALAPNDEAYVFLVSHRRPQRSLLPLAIVQLRPLQEPESKRLIAMLAANAGIRVTPGQISELTEYVAGYPPAVYFAVQQAKNYGVDLVMRDKSRLVQFRTSVFLRHLGGIGLRPEEQAILRLLAFYSPIPLQVMSVTLSVEPTTLADLTVRLIDLALLITTEDGLYRIADPVADAALNAFGLPSDSENKALARALADFLASAEIESSRLQLSRVLFRAARLANERGIADTAIHLAGDLIRLTETLYHARRYSDAIATGRAALEERGDSITARAYLIRALIQDERWQEAESEIAQLRRYAPAREVLFLLGFLERKRGSTRKAIDAYKQAEEMGWHGAAISRELALCHFLLGEHDDASRYIEEALRRHRDNRFVVDLWAQIAISRRDEAAAREALEQLRLIDKPVYYYHRVSRVELAFGRPAEALAAARKAVESEDPPPFEALAQLAYCEIELNNLREAEDLLARLDRQFGHVRRDVRVGLRCRLEIGRGHFGEALAQSDRIGEKTTFFYKRIRRDALEGRLRSTALKDSERRQYEAELAALETELTEVAADRLLPPEIVTLPHRD